MQRLKQHIEKRFGDGIEYKGKFYDYVGIDYIITNPSYPFNNRLSISKFSIDVENTFQYIAHLSINDLCSPECIFLENLDRERITNYRTEIDYKVVNYGTIPYHRMQLSLLNDEQKILYIINNTK